MKSETDVQNSKTKHVCNICKKEYDCPSSYNDCSLPKQATCEECYDKLTAEHRQDLII